jgi:hypothetical protein
VSQHTHRPDPATPAPAQPRGQNWVPPQPQPVPAQAQHAYTAPTRVQHPTNTPVELPAPAKKSARRFVLPLVTFVLGLLIGLVAHGGGSSTPTSSAASPTTQAAAPAAAAPAAPAAAAPAAAPAQPAGPQTSFSDGTYTVPDEIAPGTYSADGSKGTLGSCYWAREKDTSGDMGAIIANGNAAGPVTVTIKASDKAFETSGGCTWTKK